MDPLDTHYFTPLLRGALAGAPEACTLLVSSALLNSTPDTRPPPSRTKWTRRVPHHVLIGHAASPPGPRGRAALRRPWCSRSRRTRAAGAWRGTAAQHRRGALRARLHAHAEPPGALQHLAPGRGVFGRALASCEQRHRALASCEAPSSAPAEARSPAAPWAGVGGGVGALARGGGQARRPSPRRRDLRRLRAARPPAP